MEPRTFPATLDALGPIRDCVKAAAAQAGLGRTEAYQLMLAVDEIATNIILHGFEEKGLSGDVGIRSSCQAGRLQVVLEDGGPPFDPRSVPLPGEEEFARPLEERPVGGLGLLLAFKGVDRFDYRREDGHNHNIFEVDLKRGTP